ncbi:MAG: FAD-dependent oxidoreductase [Coriobacteriales bacterium]|jgi:succinate dehydrogenase/fumarate reductase flavoprotein subunit
MGNGIDSASHGEGTQGRTLSRRDLVLGCATAGVAAGVATSLSGTRPNAARAETAGQDAWDYEADVVVVGYGGAGASAAITAHDAGAEVIVLEKLDRKGGSTAVSGGGFVYTKPEDVQSAVEYYRALQDGSNANYDEGMLEDYVEQTTGILDWLTSIMPERMEYSPYGSAGYPQVVGADVITKYCCVDTQANGADPAGALFAGLDEAVTSRGITVLMQTPAKHLILGDDGQVAGVLAEQDGMQVRVRARRGVCMTCGGFLFNPEMLSDYVKGVEIGGVGCEGNTGDGIRMCQEVGAGLWHMNATSGGLGFHPDGGTWSYAFPGIAMCPNSIFVDTLGKRFCDEASMEAHGGMYAVDKFVTLPSPHYERIPSYLIFDQATFDEKPTLMIGRKHFDRQWSADNSEEVDLGWIVKADSIEELAQSDGLDPQTLAQTVQTWNDAVRSGNDADFGRDVTGLSPIETGPFYSIRLTPALINTQGGPRRTVDAQVVDAFGEPIPRLFSAGEMGSMFGLAYQGASNVCKAMIYGRKAGAGAAACAPRD